MLGEETFSHMGGARLHYHRGGRVLWRTSTTRRTSTARGASTFEENEYYKEDEYYEEDEYI